MEQQLAYIANYNVISILKNFLDNIAKVSGIYNADTHEIKTNYKKADGEVVLSGRSNCFIVLGRDRDAGLASGKGGRGETGAAAIDIIAGHMGSKPIDKILGQEILSDKDFKNDSARIYLSQKSSIDKYFQIPTIGLVIGNKIFELENADNKSAVAVKADMTRIIARENIKIVTFHRGLNSQSKKGTDGGIDIIAGCNALSADSTLTLQPMVKGNNLIELLKKMLMMIENVQSTVATFMETQKKINDTLANHVHQTGAAGRATSPTVGNNGSSENFELLTRTLPDILKNYISKVSIESNYFNPASTKYINSLWNRVN